MLAYRGRSDVARYLSTGVWTREKCERELAIYATAPFDSEGDELVLVAETLNTGEVIGEVGLIWLANPVKTAEVGYVFNPAFGGKGLATEAVRRTINLASTDYGFEEVIAKTDLGNKPSRALLERNGMHLLKTTLSADGRNVPECTYSLRLK